MVQLFAIGSFELKITGKAKNAKKKRARKKRAARGPISSVELPLKMVE